MNPPEFEQRMADYLGAELEPIERAEFERLLAADPAAQKRVDALRTLAAAVRELPATVPPVAPQPLIWKRVMVVLRYAAVILLAFAAGYGVRGAGGGPPETVRTVAAVPAAARSVTDSFAERYARAVAAKPGASTLSHALLAMGRTGPQP